MDNVDQIPAITTAIHWIGSSSAACGCTCPRSLGKLQEILSNLESTRSGFDGRLHLCTTLVVIGVVIELVVVPFEYWFDWREYLALMKRYLKGGIPHPQEPLWLLLTVEIIGAMLVVVGVSGELIYDGKIRCVDNQIQEADNARADLLESEHVALVKKMLEIYGRRHLTAEQSKEIAQKLPGLKGAKIDVYIVEPGNTLSWSDDAEDIGDEIVRTLRIAGMNAEGWRGETCHGVTASAVSLAVTSKNPSDREIASRILSALISELGAQQLAQGTDNDVTYCDQYLDLDPTSPHRRGRTGVNINIIVGKKIQPVLKPEMLKESEDREKP